MYQFYMKSLLRKGQEKGLSTINSEFSTNCHFYTYDIFSNSIYLTCLLFVLDVQTNLVSVKFS